MGSKKGRRVRLIEVPTDSVPEFVLGDTAADIQWRREDREAREREAEAQKQREEARRKLHTRQRREWKKSGGNKRNARKAELDTG